MIKNNILPEEQRGCARNAYGCKDQLLINKTIIEDCKKKKKNLSMAWIDYTLLHIMTKALHNEESTT